MKIESHIILRLFGRQYRIVSEDDYGADVVVKTNLPFALYEKAAKEL